MNKNRRRVLPEGKFFSENQVSWAAIEATRDYPPLFSQVGVIFLFLFLVTGAIYSFRTQVPVIIEGQGRVISADPPVPIRSSATFTIDQVFVKENDVVKKGDPLTNSAENLKPEEMLKLRTYLVSVAQINSRAPNDLCLSCEPLLSQLGQIYLGIRTQGEVLNLISPMNDQVRQLKQLIDTYNDIEKGLVATRLQVKNAKRKLAEIRKRKAEQILAKEVEDLESVVVGGETQMNERFRSSAMQIREARSILKSRTKELNERLEQFGKSYRIVAPLDGKIINLKLKGVGELVSSGQVLMDIVPAATQMMASLDISNKDISNIRVGDDVIVSFDSLPELDYGTMNAKIKEVIQAENIDNARSTDHGFRVTLDLEKQQMTRGQEVKPLLMSMTLKGRIVTRYESLAMSMYRIMFKVKDDIQVKK